MNLVFIHPNSTFGIKIENLILLLNSVFHPNNKEWNSVQFQFCRIWNWNYNSVFKYQFHKQNRPLVKYMDILNILCWYSLKWYNVFPKDYWTHMMINAVLNFIIKLNITTRGFFMYYKLVNVIIVIISKLMSQLNRVAYMNLPSPFCANINKLYYKFVMAIFSWTISSLMTICIENLSWPICKTFTCCGCKTY